MTTYEVGPTGELAMSRGGGPGRSPAVLTIGLLLTGISLLVLGTLVFRFVRDDLNGFTLRQPRFGLRAMVPAVVGIIAGILITRSGRRIVRREKMLLTLAIALVVGGAVVASIHWYPSGTKATIVAFDPDTGRVVWRTRTPATELLGILSKTAQRIVLEGQVDHGGCGYEFLAISIDRTTGGVSRVADLTSPPPDPVQPQPSEFQFVQGSNAVYCDR